MFNPSEFANIARTEEKLWWFRGMHAISFGLLDPLLRTGHVQRVLEAGCGTGHFAATLRDRYGLPRVTAVDLEPEALQHCSGRPGLAPVRASVTHLPFPDSVFDLAVCLDVLVHFPAGKEGAPIAELVRVLRPGGFLLLRAAAFRVFRSRHSEYVLEQQRFTRPQLQTLAETLGLRILRLTYANFLLSPVALLRFRVWEPLTRQAPASGLEPLPSWLNRLLYTPLAIEKRWIARGGAFPWGQSLVLLGQKPE
jgi:SAM-dependent methyltransferase